MPEGDAVWRTARRLDQALAGAPLTLVDLRWPELPDLALTGASTLEVRPRGKHLLQRLDNGWTLHSHLRMEGSWRIVPAGSATVRALRARDVRAALGTQTWTAVGVALGMLDLVRTRDEGTLVGHLGPDVLGPDWSAEQVLTNLDRFDGSLGAALLDQRVLAGVGTIWASESLFRERIAPTCLVASLTQGHLRAVIERAHRLMTGARDGRTVPLARREGAYEVYGRIGRSCRRCGTTVAAALIGTPPRQRRLAWCPACQA